MGPRMKGTKFSDPFNRQSARKKEKIIKRKESTFFFALRPPPRVGVPFRRIRIPYIISVYANICIYTRCVRTCTRRHNVVAVVLLVFVCESRPPLSYCRRRRRPCAANMRLPPYSPRISIFHLALTLWREGQLFGQFALFLIVEATLLGGVHSRASRSFLRFPTRSPSFSFSFFFYPFLFICLSVSVCWFVYLSVFLIRAWSLFSLPFRFL